MHPNEKVIETFYAAFQKRDARTMADCYDADAEFSDPVFQNLKGKQVPAMWRMLCERGKDLKIEFSDIHADEHSGKAHWEAEYTFSATGRKVHNKIEAAFELKNGKIVRHTDVFNLWQWTKMALGFKGLLLGWTPLVQNVIRKQANQSLEKFIKHENIS
ncbi:nuclear transport factor 2 family protein [bacterium]|nr:MAG: nuclear transport factor 2 family protein [bacterium]